MAKRITPVMGFLGITEVIVWRLPPRITTAFRTRATVEVVSKKKPARSVASKSVSIAAGVATGQATNATAGVAVVAKDSPCWAESSARESSLACWASVISGLSGDEALAAEAVAAAHREREGNAGDELSLLVVNP